MTSSRHSRRRPLFTLRNMVTVFALAAATTSTVALAVVLSSPASPSTPLPVPASSAISNQLQRLEAVSRAQSQPITQIPVVRTTIQVCNITKNGYPAVITSGTGADSYYVMTPPITSEIKAHQIYSIGYIPQGVSARLIYAARPASFNLSKNGWADACKNATSALPPVQH